MSFKDFDELVAPAPKALPIGGKWYEFPAKVPAATGLLMLKVHRHQGVAKTVDELMDAAGITPEHLAQITDDVLGDTLAELVADGKGGAVARALQALTAWHLYGQDAAEAAWNRVGPTAAPNRTARRASKATAKSARPASTAGTTAPARRKRT